MELIIQTKVLDLKHPKLRDDLCDFNDAYIVVTGRINAENSNLPDGANYNDILAGVVNPKQVALKNYAPFFNCILKINNQLIEDAQDLDIVMPMFNLLFCSKIFRKTARSFWNYYPDKPNSGYSVQPDGQANNIYERTRAFDSIKNSESFDYKNKIVGNLPDNNNAVLQNIKIIVPLKNLRNFISNLNFLMIDTETELILK